MGEGPLISSLTFCTLLTPFSHPLLDVLNRSSTPAKLRKALRPRGTKGEIDLKPERNFVARRTRHILKHVFPRQYGLHNVFTSPRDTRITTQPLNDYTIREPEIRSRGHVRTPNRLRAVMKLVAAIAKRHDRMDYRRALDRCCPSRLPRRRLTIADRELIANELSERPTQPELPPNSEELLERARARANQKPRFANYAIPAMGQVIHFVTVIVKRLVPRDLFGSQHNEKLILRSIGEFVRARRFESLNLHQVLQGIRLTDVDWVLPPGRAARHQRATAAESLKRRELYAEFIYWLFDSLVIPLLRTTFYATESAAFRNRVLYFRQDDWAAMSRPVLDKLKTDLFEPLTRAEALNVMSSRRLGYSHIRLLPKETGVRPIVNLRRRSTRQTGGDEQRRRESERLGQSINFILQSAFHILTYEKKRADASLLGASVFGPSEIHAQLRRFASTLSGRPRLYFVKVDVACAFDSIDQTRLVDIIERILSEPHGYLVQRYAQISPGPRPRRAFVKRARADSEQVSFPQLATELANALRHVVFVDGVSYRHEERDRLLHLLRQHVTGNLVKIGSEFYRQRVGIPQGSSLSTMLCSFFYADMEASRLAFDHRSLLLRYTDDFLLITRSKSTAKAFYRAMSDGHPEWGCFIAREKSLANFDMLDPHLGVPVTRVDGRFPWCGVTIDTRTLGVQSDLSRYAAVDMRDTLTVERGRKPGAAFVEKLLQTTRARSHPLYVDPSLNGRQGSWHNILSSFTVSALKFAAYAPHIAFSTPFLLRKSSRLFSTPWCSR